MAKLAHQKKDLEKKRFQSPADHENFLSAVRAHSNLNRKIKERKRNNLLSANESKFKRDKFTFAKEVLQESSERAEPTFDKTAAESFLAANYGAPKVVDVQKLRKWIKEVPESSIVSD